MKLSCVVTGSCQTNTYIIEENGGAVVIDPGCDVQRIRDELRRLKLVPKYAVITHCHFDHIGGANAMQADGAKIYVPKTDYDILKKSDFYIRLGFGDEAVEPFEADVEIEDRDVFNLLGHEFKAIATPGHTPGGMCYVVDGKFIFSGDTLFRLCIGRTDLPLCDDEKMTQSLKRLFLLKGDYEVYPGHDRPTTLDFERKYNAYAKI